MVGRSRPLSRRAAFSVRPFLAVLPLPQQTKSRSRTHYRRRKSSLFHRILRVSAGFDRAPLSSPPAPQKAERQSVLQQGNRQGWFALLTNGLPIPASVPPWGRL